MNTSVPILSFAGAVACASCSWAATPDDAFSAERRQGGTAQPATSTQAFAAIDRQAALVERARNGDVSSYAPDGSAVALSQKTAGGMVLAAGSGNMSGKFFGLEASGLAPLEVTQENIFNAPYYAMVRDADHVGVSFAMGKGSRVRLGALSGRDAALELPGPLQGEHGKRFLSSAEFEQKLGRAVGIVSVGMLREKGAMLGSQQGQALALNASPTTTFTSVSAGYALTSSSSLVAMASYGKTEGIGSADSLMAQVSAVRTVAYSMGMASNRIWRDNDRLGLTFAIPAKVRTGTLDAAGAAFRAAPGYGTTLLNLRPTATERDMEMTYSTPFGKDGRLGRVTGAIMLRINPGHDASVGSDWLTGVRYSRGF